jgi:hypothetical protein
LASARRARRRTRAGRAHINPQPKTTLAR